MKPRIYVDTSIVGGYFDEIFEKDTKLLFEKLKKGEVTFVVSDLLRQELETAPEEVKTLLSNYKTESFEFTEVTDEAKMLAQKYIDEKVVGATSFDDCVHIAMATICRVSVLASWNFRHIVNLHRIQGYNAVNLKNGYPMLEIRSPKDLISYEDN
jgi:hypothetical protein